MDVQIERSDVEVPGGTLATYKFGGSGPPVLAVHGITANSHEWVAVARALDGRATLVAPDLRGRAASNGLHAPYGVAAYVRDLLAVLDTFGLEQPMVVGHSLGAYILARLAADHPERARFALLVDGGLTLPATMDVAPQEFINGFLGPALARLSERFPSYEEYRQWWRRHPAFRGDEVADDVLAAYADHDLVGEPPELRSSVLEEAVRADAEELFELGAAAHRMAVPAMLLCAPRGLLDEPKPMQPLDLVAEWAAENSRARQFAQVPNANHYTIVLGDPGARAVADAIARYLNGP